MKKITLSLLAVAFLFSCKKDDDTAAVVVPAGPTYEVPKTYNFDNVSYSGQTARLDMLGKLTDYVKTGNKVGVTLDAQKLKDMFANTPGTAAFNDTTLESSGKQLKSKCFSLHQSKFDKLFDDVAAVSGQTGGSNGVAGIVTSGTKSYLCDENGFEYAQLIDKGLMGAVFYYQATGDIGYLSGLGADDNVDVTAGKGTKREHHFDEAFGYFGAPLDFPTGSGRYWAKYAGKTKTSDLSQEIMDAWLKGRAAISNKDEIARIAAVTEIKNLWEKVIVGAALYYINSARKDIADDALRNHQLSEAVAFIGCLKYNDERRILDTEVTKILDEIGGNLYATTAPKLTDAATSLASVYGLDATKY